VFSTTAGQRGWPLHSLASHGSAMLFVRFYLYLFFEKMDARFYLYLFFEKNGFEDNESKVIITLMVDVS
jgi:hypothetical protein